MRFSFKLTAILIALMIVVGCANKKETAFQGGLSLYDQNKLEEALPFFEMASKQGGVTAETYAYLAETYRRLGELPNLQSGDRKSGFFTEVGDPFNLPFEFSL